MTNIIPPLSMFFSMPMKIDLIVCHPLQYVMVSRIVRHTLAAVLLCTTIGGAQSSDGPTPSKEVRGHKFTTLNLTVGAGVPHSRQSLKEFWLFGVSGGASFQVGVSRALEIGLGVDMATFFFDETAFASTFPGVDPMRKDVVITNIFVNMKYSPFPLYLTSPYINLNLGALRMTRAVNQKVVNGVRVTYYDVGGTARLAVGVAVGLDFYVTPSFSFQVEVKPLYVHNDPALGWMTMGRGGVRFTL